MDLQASADKLENFLKAIVRSSGLNLTYTLTVHPPSAGPNLPTRISVDFDGPDVPLLLARNAELLLALEHLATGVLRLESDQHDQISFDAGGFKSTRDRSLRLSAREGIECVRRTGRPYAFPPMNSRERRLLHLALASSGLRTASQGEEPRRHLILYPPSRPIPES